MLMDYYHARFFQIDVEDEYSIDVEDEAVMDGLGMWRNPECSKSTAFRKSKEMSC